MKINAPVRPWRSYRRPGYALALLLALLIAALPAGGPALGQEAALTLTVTPAFEGNYAPDRWLPLSIVLRNNGPATRVVVAASAPGVNTRSVLPLDLAGGAETVTVLYAAMDRQARELRVTVERDGAVLAEQAVPVRPREGERMFGVVSAQPLQLSLPRRQDLNELPFLTFSLGIDQLPTHPAGLSSLSLLLLNGVSIEGLAPAQLDTISAWVRNGGHLILGGGLSSAAALTGLPPDLVVADPGPIIQLSPAALADYTGVAAPAQIEGIVLEPRPGTELFGEASAPLWVQGQIGLGRITHLAFDPGLRAVVDWPGAPALWDRLLRPVAVYGHAFGSDPFPDLLREGTLATALGNLPAVNLPDSNLLFALLALYAVLIGPGMALLLRRLDRQSLGWVALPAAALFVFLVGSGLALAGRADQRIVSQITLIEQVDADSARARTALAILSPRPETFALSLRPSALVRPIQPNVSQYGPIVPVDGDLSQQSGSMIVGVEPWTIQGLLAEDLVALPALDAAIQLGPNGNEAIVRNTTGTTLRDVAVAYGAQVVDLGTLAPGEEARATWPPSGGGRADANTPLSARLLGEALAEARSAGGQADRRLLIREALITAAVGRGSLGDDAGPLVLAWVDINPLEIAVAADGAANQQIGLLVARPQIGGSGAVSIPAGWMRLRPAEDGRLSCRGQLGTGLPASPQPLTMTLALPPGLATLRASDLSLDLQSERDWPNAGVRTELYNWDEARWVEFDFDGPGTLVSSQAGPYVEGGELRLRLSGRIDEAGCVFPAVSLRGEL